MPSWRKIIVSGSDASLNSLNVATNVVAQSFTGSLFGTSSWANNTISSSYAVTSSYTLNALSSSFASTASYVNPLRQNVILTGSLLVTQSYISTVDYIDFTLTANPAHNEGRIHWIDDTKTLNVDTDVNNFYIELGHQNVVRVNNQNSFTLTKGTVVYINGENGQRPTVATASFENDGLSAATLGLVAQDINSGQNGYVVTRGIIRDINTNAYSPGTMLFLSASGQYTSTVPVAPLHQVRLGRTITQATAGTIYVDIMNGYEIGELHDVLETNRQNGDLIVFDSGSRVYKNSKILSGSYGISGSLTVSEGITGSLFGTASEVQNAAVKISGSTLYSTVNSLSDFATNNSVLLGSSAGTGTSGGSFAVLIGDSAGQNATNMTYTVGIGSRAGLSQVSSSYSIFIGRNAGRAAATANQLGRNNIVIGTGISLSGSKQDSINIGGLIFGSGSYYGPAAGTTFLGSANGKVGINQPDPLYSFDVSGSGNYTNGLTVTGSLNVTQIISASSNIYSAVDIVAAQNLNSLYSSGDEGGEIFLNKPVTNTAITGGITIDVYQNKLRIFEQGGTNRGGYWDITALATGVGTNLLSGGSGATLNGGTNVDNRLITATGTTPELNGEANLTFDGTTLGVTGNVTANSFTGSLLGTSSYASQALSSSYALTASYSLNASPAFPYTGSAIISGSLIVTGSVSVLGTAAYRKVVENQNSGYTITSQDFGKTFICNSSTAQTFNLPSANTADIGFEVTIIKYGEGKITIDAPGSDVIQDSGAGGTIYCSDTGIASITLLIARTSAWVITSAVGTWITTD